MILWRNIEKKITFYHFNSDPRFPTFLLHVRCKSGALLDGVVSLMSKSNRKIDCIFYDEILKIITKLMFMKHYACI